VHPLDSKPDHVSFKKILFSIAAPSLIYQYGQPFANSFGGITHWYVTSPQIQLVFDTVPYLLWRMMFYVPYILLKKFQDLQYLG
jgi:hypothetical protein